MAKTKKAGTTKAASVKPPALAKPAALKPGAGKDDAAGGKRKLGLRGAAPWAARHAAKHAAEARARAAEPPLPGSARATIRTPADAEDIKERVRDLHAALAQIKGFRKNLSKTFFDIGLVLKTIETRRLYEAKRFPSFEAFVEREKSRLLRCRPRRSPCVLRDVEATVPGVGAPLPACPCPVRSRSSPRPGAGQRSFGQSTIQARCPPPWL